MSLHIPWDDEDPNALKEQASDLNLGFDAMNSNTFQDQPGQTHMGKQFDRYGEIFPTCIKSDYRQTVAKDRPTVSGAGGGIV